MNEIQSSQDIKAFCPHHYSHKKATSVYAYFMKIIE